MTRRLGPSLEDRERRCQEVVDTGQCRNEGVVVRLRCPRGRPDAVAAFCAAHGGEARARAAAQADWNYVAPESVDDVEDAGCMGLQTSHAYVVVRQVPPDQGGIWLAWLGLGSLLTPVANPNGERRQRGGRRHGKQLDRPPTSFPTRNDALEAACAEWRRGVEARVDEIRRARGGTLAWGTPVEPLGEPIIILLEQGDSRSAWDVARALPRRSREGVGWLRGLRPSGECV